MDPTKATSQEWYDAKEFGKIYARVHQAIEEKSQLARLVSDVVLGGTDVSTLDEIKKCLRTIYAIWDKIFESIDGKMYVLIPSFQLSSHLPGGNTSGLRAATPPMNSEPHPILCVLSLPGTVFLSPGLFRLYPGGGP